MITNQKLIAVKLLLVTLAAICLSAGVANARPTFQGKFTLPHAARWGKAVLPAGEYSLRLDYVDGAGMITIRDFKSAREVAFILCPISEHSGKGENALLISTRGNQSVVHSLRLTELGVTFIYDPALAHGREMVEEVRNTSVVPVTVAKK